jgi:hypothetical protein
MRRRGASPLPIARHGSIALILVVAACTAGSVATDPQCIAAREQFGQIWPAVANAFGMPGTPPGNAPPEIVGGSFGSTLTRIPERWVRQGCYDSTMRSFGFLSYPPFEQVDALRR